MARIKKDQFAGEEEHEEKETPEPEEDSGEVKELPVEPDPNEEPTGDDDAAKEARKERRQNRFKEAMAAKEAAENRALETERQLNEANARAAAAQESARMVALYQQSQQVQRDPWQDAIDNEITTRRRALRAEHADLVRTEKYDAEQQNRLMAEWQKTETRLQEIVTNKQLYYRDVQARQNAPNPQEAATQAVFNSKMQQDFPDIVQDRRYLDHMTATYFKLLAENKPNTWETASLAAAETRRAFKLGHRPPPDAATKARYSGVGGGSNGAGNGVTNGKIAMTPRNKTLAHSRYPDLSEAAAEKKWAQTVGPRLMKAEEE